MDKKGVWYFGVMFFVLLLVGMVFLQTQTKITGNAVACAADNDCQVYERCKNRICASFSCGVDEEISNHQCILSSFKAENISEPLVVHWLKQAFPSLAALPVEKRRQYGVVSAVVLGVIALLLFLIALILRMRRKKAYETYEYSQYR